MRAFVLLASLALGPWGCSARGARQAETPVSLSASDCLVAGDAWLAADRPFEASAYYEAALERGSNPLAVLPRLCLAEARAGRLRDAKQRLDELAELAPLAPEAASLRHTLESLLAPRSVSGPEAP